MLYRINVVQVAIAAITCSTISLAGAAEAQARDYFGAIAYSEATGYHGFSYDYPNRVAAESRAIQECKAYSNSGDCRVLIWFRNACGALATASNGAYGSGWGEDRAAAEDYALDGCEEAGGDCSIARWVCTAR